MYIHTQHLKPPRGRFPTWPLQCSRNSPWASEMTLRCGWVGGWVGGWRGRCQAAHAHTHTRTHTPQGLIWTLLRLSLGKLPWEHGKATPASMLLHKLRLSSEGSMCVCVYIRTRARAHTHTHNV